MKKVALLSLFILSSLCPGYAQDSLRTTDLEEVVVTGQYEPQSIKKSVYQARVITMEVLAAKGAVRLQDVLNTELNIRFEQDPALGGSNLSLQGLQGQNVKVLIDGVPMVGRQGTTNEININQINVQSIERIEIIEGPMSVVYGADALAGVINIITKKSAEGKLELGARIHEETIGKEYGLKKGIHNESVSVGFAKNRFHVRTDFNRNYFGGWQGLKEGRDKQWHPKTQYLADVLTGYTDSKLNFYYRADYLFEDIYNPGGYGEFEAGKARDQHYYTNRLMQQLQGAYTFSPKTQANALLSYTLYERETQTTTVDEATGEATLSPGAGLQDITRFSGLTFRGTAQHKVNKKLSFQPGIEVNLESGSGGRIQEGTQEIADYAFFLSGEWNVMSWLQVRPGVRMVKNSVYNAPPAIPSINTKIKLSEKSDLRLAYGRGFRAPSLRELYFDFVDASHNIIGNTNLEAEFSDSYNASFNYTVLERDRRSLTTVLGTFYNNVDNMIGYTISQSGGIPVTTYTNIDHFKTKGFTFNNTWKSPRWNVSAGLGMTARYNNYSESVNDLETFTWSTEFRTTTSFNIQSKGIILSAYYKFTGKTPFYEPVTIDGNPTIRLAETSSYHWADFSIQKSIGKMFSATIGSRNLLDVKDITSTAATGGAHSPSGNRSIGSGRSYFISLSYTLNK